MIIGLDLSTTASGYAVLDNKNIITYGVIVPNDGIRKVVNKQKNPELLDSGDRVKKIQEELFKIIFCSDYNITEVFIEDVPLASNRNMKDAHDLILLVGMICGICNTRNVKWTLYYPSSWRKIVKLKKPLGFVGRMKREDYKLQGIKLVNSLYSLDLVLPTLNEKGKTVNSDNKTHSSDIADAVLIAYAGYLQNMGVKNV